MHVGERDHRAHRAGAADDDVGIGEHGRQVVEREGVGRDAEFADLLGQPLRAGQRPVDDVDAFDACARQMLCRQRAHRTRADDDRAASGQSVQLGVGHAERDGHHRGACGVDTGLGVHPLADRQCALGQLVQGAADGVVGLGGGVGAAHLAEHLLFADHRRIQATGDGEQVLDGRLGVADVGVLGEVAQPHAGMFGEHLADHRQAAVEGIDDRVDLDAVTGGQHHGLGHQRGLQHLVDDLGLIGLVGAQLLQHGDRRAAVRNAEKQHAHGLITTSSTVVLVTAGHQICDVDTAAVIWRDRPAAWARRAPSNCAPCRREAPPAAGHRTRRAARDHPPRPPRRRRWSSGRNPSSSASSASLAAVRSHRVQPCLVSNTTCARFTTTSIRIRVS